MVISQLCFCTNIFTFSMVVTNISCVGGLGKDKLWRVLHTLECPHLLLHQSVHCAWIMFCSKKNRILQSDGFSSRRATSNGEIIMHNVHIIQGYLEKLQNVLLLSTTLSLDIVLEDSLVFLLPRCAPLWLLWCFAAKADSININREVFRQKFLIFIFI